MAIPNLKFCKVRDVKSPERGTKGSAGIDFYVPNFRQDFVIHSHTDLLIPSGIRMLIPKGYMLMAADKSGVVTSSMACIAADRVPKSGSFNSILTIGAKIIDEDYEGEIFMHVLNVGNAIIRIKPGIKLAQFILIPVLYATPKEVSPDLLDEFYRERMSERGINGFGSTD